MGRLFGTDGIRGIANRDLSLRRATEVGMALAEVIRSEHPGERPAVVIGRDTRLSGDMLQSALAGGLMAGGADVVLLGVIPTPAVAYLTVQKKAAAGVVISASHNPYEFNGIKIFGPEGYKLTDDEEDEIERMLLDRDIPLIPGGAGGDRRLHRGPRGGSALCRISCLHRTGAVGRYAGAGGLLQRRRLPYRRAAVLSLGRRGDHTVRRPRRYQHQSGVRQHPCGASGKPDGRRLIRSGSCL